MTPSRPVAGALRLTLLGPAAAQSGTDAVRCTSRKAFALFAYLVLERRPHSRRALSSLFWGGRDPEASRTSLRATLFRLPAPMAGCLAVERETIGVAPHAAIDCDAVAFDRLAADGGLDAAQQAAALYQGHLLADFEADATPEFDDWVSRERTRLKRAAWQVFERVIAWHADALPRAPGSAEGRAREAAALARRWLALDPAAEPAHRWLIRLDVEAGRGDAAMAQYESCRRALAVAEGRAPAADTKALVASLGRGAEAEPASGRPSAPPRPHEPAPIPHIASTSFVGRIEEVAEIARLVADPACRLVTLHGLGGVGKTRLADAVARQVAGDFAHGVAWVALESVERPEAVAATIARAIGLEAAPRTPPRSQLVQALRPQERLLVLDNLEHLLAQPVAEAADDPVDLVLTLLREAPGVRFLVTSRETLGVQEEWVYDVEGLAHRHRAAVDDDAGVLPAVELFAQRARQAYLGFSLTAEMPHVRRVCALVDGLPLGIELAAAWVRTIPCAEIAQELERGADALPAAQRNRPARQQTLRAVVEFSWRLLTPEQQDVLAALAQCHGGFSREAAEHVAQASLRTLSALVDKALVRRGPDSRFSLHPLVRRFAAEKLALTPARAARARTRHADHYLRLLCTQLGALHGPRHLESRTAIEDDLDNIRAAWAAKVDERDLDVLGAAARPLALAFDRLGLYEEWTRTFERALGVVPAPETRTGYRRLLLNAANGYWRQGDVAQADACRQRLDAMIAMASDPSELAEYHKLAGLVVRDAGDIDGALAHFELASAAAAQSGDRIIQAHIANEIGVVHWRHGALARARDAFVACLAQCEAADDVFDAPLALHNIGYCDVELGRFDDAQARLQRALAMFRERGHARGETMVLASLGVLARRRGDLEQAEAFGRASLALAERIGNTLAVADTLDDLGQVLAQRGALDDAVALFDRALAMARKLGQVHLQCFVLLHRARAQAARAGAPGAAQSLRDALALAGEHDFPTGRLMGLLGAAGLRAMAGDADALPAAARWCSAAIAAADGNVDVLGAVPTDVPRACIEAAVAPETHAALEEATAFVAAQCGGGATPVAAG